MRHKGTKIAAVTETEFSTRHNHQRENSSKDVFLIWFALMFISVVASHFLLNLSGNGLTGYVVASVDPVGNMTLLVQALFVLFVAVFVAAIGYHGITRHDN